MAESPNVTLDDVIAAVVMAIRQAHAIGKHDALVSIFQTASAGLRDATTAPTVLPASARSGSGASVFTGKRARAGTVKGVVREFVFGADRPVTEAEFANLHPEVNRSSRYMAFRGLAEAGEIAKSGDAWVPASKGVGNPDAAASGLEQQAGEGLGGR